MVRQISARKYILSSNSLSSPKSMAQLTSTVRPSLKTSPTFSSTTLPHLSSTNSTCLKNTPFSPLPSTDSNNSPLACSTHLLILLLAIVSLGRDKPNILLLVICYLSKSQQVRVKRLGLYQLRDGWIVQKKGWAGGRVRPWLFVQEFYRVVIFVPVLVKIYRSEVAVAVRACRRSLRAICCIDIDQLPVLFIRASLMLIILTSKLLVHYPPLPSFIFQPLQQIPPSILLSENQMLPGQQQSNPYSLYILLTLLLLMVYTVAGNWFEHKHIHVIHETGLGILIGIVAGGILFWTNNREGLEGFSGEIFFYALLPPIIFEGGYNLKKSRLFQNFNYISIFGILGTLVSFFVIYGLTHVINSQGWIRPSNDFSKPIFLTQQLIMLYSATICATDSVAALTMIKPDKYPKLFSIVFGQGMVNDAVAIILFRAVGQLHHSNSDHEQSDTAPIVSIIENFLLNLACSLLIGLVSGLFCTFVCKHIRKLTEKKAENYVLEISLSFFFGFLAYGAAELTEFSGVISVLVCGISMAHFNFYNLSQNGQLLTGVSFKAISFGCESFLFVYLGMESWFYLSGQKQWSLTFILLQLIICSIARFACIFGLSGFFYLFMRKKWSVNFYQLAIIWFAGIIRGSVAFALILTIQAPQHQLVQVIQSTVLIMVFLTTIILGGIMPNFVSCCLARAQLMQQKKAQAKLTINANLLPPEVAGSMVLSIEEEPPREKKEKGCAKRVWGNIDEKYLKPFFIYNYELRKDQIKLAKKKMKMNSDAFKGASDVFKKPSLLGSDAEDKSKKDQHVLGPIEEEEDKDMS